jgi:two-component system nitrogen regulation sensor histidine kinase NtrY
MVAKTRAAQGSARSATPLPKRGSVAIGRPPFRDNTRLLLLGVAVLFLIFVGLLTLASRSSELAPDFLTDFILYALSATNLAMLVCLVFVLARNIVKLVVEKRRALPFARFRAKLVGVLLGMTLVPAVMVLIVGSEVINNSVDRWFNAPMEDVLASANAIAGDYYSERQRLVSIEAERLAVRVEAMDLDSTLSDSFRNAIVSELQQERIGAIGVYRVTRVNTDVRVDPIVDLTIVDGPPGVERDISALAESAARLGEAVSELTSTVDGGDLISTAIPIRASPSGEVNGVVIASDYLAGAFAQRARSMTSAYEDYQQLRVLRQPLAGVYQSFFLMLTLMILVAATWMGLYLAKRITRPVQLLAAAAREIGAGRLDYRVVPETTDEFGTLIDAFNSMAGDVAADRRRLEQSALDLERRHEEVEARRQFIETILNRLATGVISIEGTGVIRSANAAAARLLGVEKLVGERAVMLLGQSDLKPLEGILEQAIRGGKEVRPTDVTIVRDGREVYLAVMAVPLRGGTGVSGGTILVLEDVTPLVRAQRVAAWREVARRLAHEIKNPLTPIQLCAERVRRHFSDAPPASKNLVEECTSTIVGEVESLKDLVDEFSQFARMPAPRVDPTNVTALLDDVLGLYRGIFSQITIHRRFESTLPLVVADREQLRRVVINLIDNAVEALEQCGTIEIETSHDSIAGVVRIVVADDGPGIPVEKRDKLFLPHYSTKRRGSGVGLAIVRRIVSEHGGVITVTENEPKGTRFTLELPC